MNCPLCLDSIIYKYHTDKKRTFFQCKNCDLVFVDPANYLNSDLEKCEYDKHENDPDDLGYRHFLNKLLAPLNDLLNPISSGLDFGSGPGPTISIMMKEQGHTMKNYDIFYADNKSLLTKQYDFITCTEVVEHFHNPHNEFKLLHSLLKPNGYLGIMTKRVLSKEKFATWHYKNDPTHVCFYSDDTFKYIAKTAGYELSNINSDTVILKKII
jgi:hypothetical protein